MTDDKQTEMTGQLVKFVALGVDRLDLYFAAYFGARVALGRELTPEELAMVAASARRFRNAIQRAAEKHGEPNALRSDVTR